MTHSSFTGLDKNFLAAASSALHGTRLSTQPVCVAYYAVSVLVYFSSAITARAIDTKFSSLCVSGLVRSFRSLFRVLIFNNK
jgi:hypothetical protein